MATKYPDNLDDLLSLPKVFDNISPILADDVNRLRDAIVAIEKELGVNPSGEWGTLKDRLENLNSIIDGAGVLGEAPDGYYDDGLFKDFTSETPVGTAVDKINEVLSSLAPPPAPNFSDISFTSPLGVEGKLSFGTSNSIAGYTNVDNSGGGSALDINGTFVSEAGSGSRKGIFANSGSRSGVLADSVAADIGSPNPSYPANSFGDGYSGTLELEVNGEVIHSVDLSSFSSGDSLNSNGTGFTNLSLPTAVKFPNGKELALFYYRTGQWIVDIADQVKGYNYLRVIHNNSPEFLRASNYFEWVVDDDTTAVSFSENIDTLTMTGSNLISGVEYHTGGTALYDVSISNLHRNTYSSENDAISFGDSVNISIASQALGDISNEEEGEQIVDKEITISPDSNNRILNGSITVKTTVDRTVQVDATSSGVSIDGILVDANIDTSTATNENLNGEKFRVPSNRSLSDTSGFTASGAELWDSSKHIVSDTPSNAGYDGAEGTDAGLLIYNGALHYPNSASIVNSGDFSSIVNGPGNNGQPGGPNPDYSGATGNRVYWRYFYFSNPSQNFRINVSRTGTNFVSVGSPLTSTDIYCEVLAPNTTQDGSGDIEFKDCVVPYTSDAAIGAFASTYGGTIPTNWGITLGSRSTATSGNVIIIKITAGPLWTGNISNINVVAV